MTKDVYEYLMQKNHKRLQLLATNPHLCNKIMGLIDGLCTYADWNKGKFKDIRLENWRITPSGQVVGDVKL